MRICFLYGGVHLTDGGIGFVRNLCRQLRALGHTCSAILGESEGLLLEDAVDQEVHLEGDWRIGPGLRRSRAQDQLRRALAHLSPEVVHIIHPSPYYGLNGHIQSLPVFMGQFKILVTFWGLNVGRGSNWRARATVAILAWGAGAVATHDFHLMKYLQWLCLGLRQVLFLPVGSNIQVPLDIIQATQSELRRRHGLDLDSQFIGYFGGFDSNNGVADLLKAVRLLRDRGYHRLRLLLIGWQRHLDNPRFSFMKQIVAQEHLEDVLLMTPYAPDQEVAELLRAADLCVFPFRYNALGRSSLMAALNAGAPVVLASTSTQLKPLEGAVVRVPPRSPQTLADTIRILLDNPDRCGQLALAGRQAWERQFSWPIIAEKHLQVYKRLLS